MQKQESKIKTWEVVRIVKEVYEAQGKTRQEALDYIAEFGNPSEITVVKETCKPKNH